MLVLEGSGAEFERGVPFGAVVDALDEHCAAEDPHALAAVPAEQFARLASLLPSLSTAGPDAGEGGGERHRALGAVRRLLEPLAARRPLVVVIDDLHWVDDSSLELITHLVRRRPRAGVLLAAVFRKLDVRGRAAVAAALLRDQPDELTASGPAN